MRAFLCTPLDPSYAVAHLRRRPLATTLGDKMRDSVGDIKNIIDQTQHRKSPLSMTTKILMTGAAKRL